MKAIKLDKYSISRRLTVIVVGFIVPMIILTLFFACVLNNFCTRYDSIVQNVTLANQYNTVFKPDMDSVMYQMVARSITKDKVHDKLNLENPDSMIIGAKNVFNKLERRTSTQKAKDQLIIICKLLDTLQANVNNLNRALEEGVDYDTNVQSLDNNIYILTELIQENISQYIYYEAEHMEIVRSDMDRQKNMILLFSVIIAIMAMIFAIGQSTLISKSITRPVAELVKATELVGQGNFEVRSDQDGGDENEITILNRSFNRMTERIGELVENIKEEQVNSKKLEMKLLQAQISPHFLYNTLDNIVWLSEDDQKEQVAELVTSLSQFFRTTLSGGHDFITIAAEIKHIDAYLQIQSFRYRDILTYDISIPDKVKEFKILKMTLQPIVENALYHGIKNKRSGGKITIDVEEFEDSIKISVKDNGIGMTDEELKRFKGLADGTIEPSEDNSGFGIANVAQRLRLYYGDDYGVRVFSQYGDGTDIEVVIPKQ